MIGGVPQFIFSIFWVLFFNAPRPSVILDTTVAPPLRRNEKKGPLEDFSLTRDIRLIVISLENGGATIWEEFWHHPPTWPELLDSEFNKWTYRQWQSDLTTFAQVIGQTLLFSDVPSDCFPKLFELHCGHDDELARWWWVPTESA